MIETSGTPSTAESSELSTTQALIASLTSSLPEAEKNRYRPRNKQGPGRGCDQVGGRGGDRRPQEVLGAINNDLDRQLTRQEDATRTKKKFKNKNYCHTHGYELSVDHDSAHYMWPEKGHKPCATAENPMGGCLLYKRLWQSYCVKVP